MRGCILRRNEVTHEMNRWDETWHRLREWTSGQAPSERLAQQVIGADGFSSIDPSHPLGGSDGGRDAVCKRADEAWVMAAYFPRGQQTFRDIEKKFAEDLNKARRLAVTGVAFVTNQELRLHERRRLTELAQPTACELYHLERVTMIIDRPDMAPVREQFLGIGPSAISQVAKGGEGGTSGGGGGGGGAIGHGARGGDGGPGGQTIIHGPQLVPVPGGQRAGGGGGGGAAAGPDLPRFDEASVLASVLEAAGLPPGLFDGVEVGRGGKGGKGGDAGLGAPARAIEERDVKAGLRVSVFGPANYIQSRNGLLDVMGIGWEFCNEGQLPRDLAFPIACILSKPDFAEEGGDLIALWVVAQDPDGRIAAREPIVVEGGFWTSRSFAVSLRLQDVVAGTWRFSVCSGAFCLAALSLNIRDTATS